MSQVLLKTFPKKTTQRFKRVSFFRQSPEVTLTSVQFRLKEQLVQKHRLLQEQILRQQEQLRLISEQLNLSSQPSPSPQLQSLGTKRQVGATASGSAHINHAAVVFVLDRTPPPPPTCQSNAYYEKMQSGLDADNLSLKGG